ncbi:MAG: hypothetical protein ABEJ94_09495 [Halorientalis sp.]
MDRHRVALIALVAAVALAGCGGLGGSGTPTDRPSNATSQTAGPYDLPLNGSEIRERHRAALIDAGNFSYRQRAVARAAGSGALLEYTNVSVRVDLSTGAYRFFENATATYPTAAYVTPNGTAYVRQRSPGQIAYDRQSSSGNGTDAYLYPPIGRYLRGLDYDYEGTDRVNGETVHVYAANSTDALDPDEHGLTALDPASLTDLSAELRVAADGSIRTFRYDVTGTGPRGDRIRYVVRVEYARVGSTTVPEPSWLDQAKRVTGE